MIELTVKASGMAMIKALIAVSCQNFLRRAIK
jgi:hypothetical protein